MQKERKGTGLLIAILLIIILILISLVGFFIYNDYYLKDDTKETNTEELSLNDARVVDIENKIEMIDFNDNFTHIFYLSNIYNSKMTYYEKINTVINYLNLYNMHNYSYSEYSYNGISFEGILLNDDEVESIISCVKTLFGPNETFNPETIKDGDFNTIVKNGDEYYLVQSNNKDSYPYFSIWPITQKAIKIDKEIKIYKKVGYRFDSDSLTTDEDGKNIIAKVDELDENTDKYLQEQMNKNLDKFDTYVFTFKLDETGNYYFYSSEKA